ncbi:MAG: response regulator [Anaerolineae bacterium]|nr:response regulator [Anaerolineae bacterium]
MFTDTGTEQIAVDAMKQGWDDYIVKAPAQFRKLPVAVRAVLKRNQARTQTIALERRYSQLLDTVPALIYIAGPELRLRYVSPYVKQLLGFSPEELLGKNPFDLAPREDRVNLVRRLRAALRTRTSFALEHRMVAADGSARWVRNLGTVLESPEFGRPVIQGVVLDITEAALATRRQMAISDVSRKIAELLPGERLQGALAALQRYVAFSTGILGVWPSGHVAHAPEGDPATGRRLEAAVAVYGPKMERIPPDSALGLAFSLRAPVIQNDTLTRAYAEDATMAEQGVRSIFAYPLILRDDLRAGLVLLADQPNAFGARDLDLLDQLGPVLSAGVESHLHWRALQELNASLEARIKERTAEIQTLYELSQRLGYSLRPEDLFAAIAEFLLGIRGVDVAAVAVAQPGAGMGPVVLHARRPLSAPLSQDLMAQTCTHLGVPFVDAMHAPELQHRVARGVEHPDQPPLRALGSVIVEPVDAADARLGGLCIASEAENALGEDHRRLLRAAASLLANALQRSQALAQAERARMEEALEAMREGVVLLDPRDRLVAANPAARKLLPMLGVPDLREGDVLREVCGFTLDDLRARTREVGPSECVIGEAQPRLVVQLSAVSYTTPTGSAGTVLTLHDITEQNQARVRMEQQARLAALGQLAGGIAHDFNNILTTLIGLAQLNLGTPNLSPELRADLEQIVQQGQRAARLVQQILDFGRRSISHKAMLRLDTFLRDLIRLLRRTIPETIAIQTDFPPEDFTIFADSAQIQQLVMNLVSNSCDAMPDGGLLTFSLRRIATDAALLARYPMMRPGQYVYLRVDDTGHGMSADVLAHAFEPFFTTKGVGKGTGLGLAQAYGIVKQHDGYIFLESQVGVGTQAHIYFPAQHEQAERPAIAAEVARLGAGQTVLVAEDEEMVRELMERMLGRLGYRAIPARNGAEALRIYKAHADEIIAVVADMIMPRMGGLELFERLREITPSLPVILTTGYSTSEDVEYLCKQGVYAVLQKPFRMQELADLLKGLWEQPDDAQAQAARP